MKKRKHEKNFIRNRSGGMKQKLPGRLLSLMCALVLVLSTVFLDLGHISAYAFGDELYLETEAEETAGPVQRLRQQIWETMSRR